MSKYPIKTKTKLWLFSFPHHKYVLTVDLLMLIQHAKCINQIYQFYIANYNSHFCPFLEITVWFKMEYLNWNKREKTDLNLTISFFLIWRRCSTCRFLSYILSKLALVLFIRIFLMIQHLWTLNKSKTYSRKFTDTTDFWILARNYTIVILLILSYKSWSYIKFPFNWYSKM